MTKAKTAWLLLGILCLASFAVAQEPAWEKYTKAGTEAYQRGQYAEAEKQFVAALKEAEKFGAQDPRLATSLNNLATLYINQGKYAEAESLLRRALATFEKAPGPEHPIVAVVRISLATLYINQAKYAEAETLFQRALATLEKALGPDHRNVATMLETHAALLRKMRRDSEHLNNIERYYSSTSQLLLVRLFQQATRYSVRACRGRLFLRICGNFRWGFPAKRLASST